MVAARSLEGKRVLVVEGNYLIAIMMCDAMRAAGAVPIGPAATTAEAITLAIDEQLDGALLEAKLGDRVAEYVARGGLLRCLHGKPQHPHAFHHRQLSRSDR